MQAYQDVFVSFAGGAPVGLDNRAVRDFVTSNASVEDLDMELLKVANPDTMQLDLSGFVQLLRNSALSDTEIIGQFQVLSNDGQSLASEECRTGLTLMCEEKLHATYPESRWDPILTMVMMDAGPSLGMEDFLRYAKLTGRYVRLIQYCGAA
jgi:hypothetical protein